MADGIVNQLAADRSLQSGMNAHRIIDLIRAFSQTRDPTSALHLSQSGLCLRF